MAEPTRLPLTGMRILDMADGRVELAGRYLADLGADVIRVEPPGGARSRHSGVMVDGVSLTFAARNANKRSVVLDLDLPGDRERMLELLGTVDVWIETTRPGELAQRGLAPAEILRRLPLLTVLSATDFGQTGPYSGWTATEPVLLAMAGVLGRSGLPGREPLLPPPGLATETSAIQAAWAAIVGYRQRRQTGRGGLIDISMFEATAQVVDPAMGTVGTATSGAVPAGRGRQAQAMYPIFPCADGHVRLVILAPRQWRSMRRWLGEPADLQGPELDTIRGRAAQAADLHARYARFFRDRLKDEVTAEAQARGVPVAPVLTIADVVDAEHYRARGAIQTLELAPGYAAALPTGCVEIDGQRAGFRHRAPEIGEHGDEVLAEARAGAGLGASGREPDAEDAAVGHGDRALSRPLAGVRVLDLGVIVLGAEIARLLADQGADVIKIESLANPDGTRVSVEHFTVGHRGSRSLGLDLRSPEGNELFKRLVVASDVVLSNFKPGTLEKLGLGYDDLRAVNDRLIMVSSSAVGATGPWSSWMGYGPLVRCAAGTTSLWRYPDDPESFSDGTTIYPDHFSARVEAVAVMAALIDRERTGHGVHIRSSQAESILGMFADLVAAESVAPGTVRVQGNTRPDAAPWNVYPCAGDDEWCVITVRDDADWGQLRSALGDPEWAGEPRYATAAGRIAQRAEIDARLTEWTRTLAPREVTARLQAVGVPAGFMQRADEYADDPHFAARTFLVPLHQPELPTLSVENAPFLAAHVPDPEIRPAPRLGQHTREIAAELLHLDAERIDGLFGLGILQEVPAPAPDPG